MNLRIAFRRGMIFALLMMLFACTSYPLGMTVEEWERLTPEQQLEARKVEAEQQRERERLRQEEQRRRERAEMKRLVADGMIYRYAPDTPSCIGGDKCPRNSFGEVILSLKQLADVDKVVFRADDMVGKKHEGKINVYADDKLVAEHIDIKQSGSWHQVLVARTVRNITLESEGDDEVLIYEVRVFGSWSSGEKRYILIQ